MNASNQKQLDRATAHGRGSLLKALAIIHRASNAKTQREIEDMIFSACAGSEFSWSKSGALLHCSEA